MVQDESRMSYVAQIRPEVVVAVERWGVSEVGRGANSRPIRLFLTTIRAPTDTVMRRMS
jgi:hypothetical protein